MKESPIILLSGGTGVGTSKYSFELAKFLDIHSITSTDAVREVLRSVFDKGVNETLGKSTYTAGQTINYEEKVEEVKRAEIIRAYKIQSGAVDVGVEGIIQRAATENTPTIIEGAHLRPGILRDSAVFKKYKDRINEIHIYISNPDVHEQRFISRQKEAPERNLEKYIENFKEIRWIHDYLFERAGRFDDIHRIDNVDNLETGLQQVKKILEKYK